MQDMTTVSGDYETEYSRRLQVIRGTATSPADKIHSVYFAARTSRRASGQCGRQNRSTHKTHNIAANELIHYKTLAKYLVMSATSSKFK